MIPVLHYRLTFPRSRRLLAVLALGAFALVPVLKAQGNDVLTGDQVKAGFIFNFTRYVEWPSAPDSDLATFHICTAGRDGVVEQLETVVHGRVVDNRKILVQPLADLADVRDCELLYVGNISRKHEERLTAAVASLPVLTVGSTPGFLRGAGMLTFVVEENRVRFDINIDLANRVNIRFDSRLLALARRTNGRGQ